MSKCEFALQNIPIRTPEGHRLRKTIRNVLDEPLPNSLLEADYHQIELLIWALLRKKEAQ